MNSQYCSLGHRSKCQILAENNSSLTSIFLYVFMSYAVSGNVLRVRCVAAYFTPSLPSLGYGFLATTKRGQMHEAMLQVNGYKAIHGIRYGMISNGLWSWVFSNDGCNNMSLSQAFRYDATTPTVLEVYCH